ncbi:D-alanyl-D-alanine carboxypeptidase [Rhodoplanes sp. Z2-YC6860]|uniref:D-alanyl-D-alanine carboxypeptidase n=1 Tax=Rhodoplanes sp. Z2-YC6860 TaxID=674703 RepID=UPI001F025333|nr:D-alanyl-D-alanine carboxypeptidase [Rhodoplanes sp. Z2-YC6860]
MSASASYSPAYAAIVVDAKTGAVLHQAAPDGLRHPASLTKIMTLYLLFERLEAGKIALDTEMPVSEEAAAQAPTKLGVRAGTMLKVEDAIGGLVTKSANDAAVVVAEALSGGTQRDFAEMMTKKARALGMSNTVYRNANGLPNDEQVTTARDQALLGIAIQQRFPKYYRYFSLANFVYRGHNMRNHNHLLGKVEGVDGIKTGYTNASGFNLVSSVKRGYRHIVAVVLGGRSAGSRDARMRELIEDTIAEASNKPGITLASDQPSLPPSPQAVAKQEIKPDLKPALQPAVSEAESAPAQPGPETTTAAISNPATSESPIRPVKVKTFAVKLVPSKGVNALTNPAAAEATPDSASPKSVRTAFAAVAPPEAEVPALAAMPAPLKAPDTVVAPVTPRAASVGKLQTASIKPDDIAVSSVPSKPTTSRGGWAIQIGAYEDEGEAKGKLSTAKGRISSLFHKAEAYVERTVKGAKTYYRARFAGFDRDQAQETCKKLKRDDIACMALKL